jgi:hypothetical protein
MKTVILSMLQNSFMTNRKQKTEIKSFEKFSSKWGTVKGVNFRAFGFHNIYK